MHKKNEGINHSAQEALTRDEKAALRRLRDQLKEQRSIGRTNPLSPETGVLLDAHASLELPTA